MSIGISNLYKTHVEIAVDVFKAQNLALVYSLKDFLTVLSSPKQVEEVLLTALYQLAEADPEACHWLLQHARSLEPELDLVESVKQFARTSLQSQGFVLDKDFGFEPDAQLYISESVKAEWILGISDGERLLIKEILHVCD